MTTNEPAVSPEALLAHEGFLAGLVRTLVFDHESAEDVLQDTWAYALGRPPESGPGLKTWLATAARNYLRQHRRARMRRDRRERVAARPERLPSTADAVERENARRRVVDAVFALKKPYRRTIVLRYLEEVPPREIAKREGVPVETVRTRTKRGLALLRTRLDAESGGDRREWCVALLPLVLSERRAAAATGGGLLAGVVAMSTKSKVVVGAVLLSLFLGVGIFLFSDGNGTASVPDTPEDPARNDLAGGPPDTPEPALVVEDEAPDVPAEETAAAKPAETGVGLRFTDGRGQPLTAEEVRRRYESAGIPLTVRVVPESLFTGAEISDIFRTRVYPESEWTQVVALAPEGGGIRLADPLVAGRYRLLVGRPSAAPMLTGTFEVTDDALSELTVPLPDEVETKRIRLVDGLTDGPLAGVSVTPWYEYGDDQLFLPGPALESDQDGYVELPVLEAAVKVGMSMRQPTWWAEKGDLVARIRRRYTPGRQPEELTVRVLRTGSVKGKAYLGNGEPASGRTILWAAKGRTARTTVGEDGSFLLTGVPVSDGSMSQPDLFLVEDLDTMKLRSVRAPVKSGETIEITIGEPAGQSRNGVLTGRITAGGKPVKGTFVITRTEGEAGKEGFVQTGADGVFRKDDVTPGKVRVQVYFGDPRAVDDFRASANEPIDLPPGNERTLDFDLPAGVFLVTVVDDETGEPVPGAVALARPENRELEIDRFPGFRYSPGWGLRTNGEGKALLLAMVPGESHKVMSGADGYAKVELTGKVPGTRENPAEITIRLKRQK